MAGKKALFRGHAVAAVAATDPHIAEDALDLIEVEYEVLPSVTDVREAMLDVAPILHENLRTRTLAPLAEPAPDKPSNIAAHRQFAMGDVEKGFAEADVIVEREFQTSRYHQGYIEPHNAHRVLEPGRPPLGLDQHAGPVRRPQLARPSSCRLPVSQITVNAVEIGGGFGGKLRHLPGAAGGAAVEEDRQGRQDDDEPRRGLRGLRPHLRHLRAGQDRREEGRHLHRDAGRAGLRGGRLPRLAGRRRHERHLRPVRLPEPAHRRLRRRRQPVEDGRLPRARHAGLDVRRRGRDQRAGRAAGHGPDGPAPQERLGAGHRSVPTARSSALRSATSR